MKKKIVQKITIIALIGILFTTNTVPVSAIGEFDAPNAGINAVTAATSSSSMGKDIEGYVREYVLDGIAVSLAQALATKLTNSVISWANGGFKGSPSFVNDYKQLFNKAQTQQGNFFLDEIMSMTSSNPLAGSVARQLAQNSRNGQFGDVFQFTLDKAIGPNWQTFTNGSFNAGGWEGWLALTQPQNNLLGLNMIAENELARRIQSDSTARQREILAGNGYLNIKECVKRGGASYRMEETLVPNPNYQSEMAAYEAAIASGDEFGAIMPEQFVSDFEAKAIPDNERPCAQERTQTPAAALKGQIDKALSVPQDRLTAADEFKEILSSTLTNLVAGLTGAGLNSLKNELNGIGSSAVALDNGAAFDVNSTTVGFGWNNPQNEISALNQTTTVTDENNNVITNDAANAAWRTLSTEQLAANPTANRQFNQIEAAIYYTTQEIEILRSNALVAQKIPGDLMTLDWCLPGPDFGYQTRLKNAATAKTKSYFQDADKADGQAMMLLRGLDLESARVNTNINLEMLDPAKNLPVAAEAFALISGARSYPQRASEIQSTLNKRQQALTTLRIYDAQWKLMTTQMTQAQTAYNQALEANNQAGMDNAAQTLDTAQKELLKIVSSYQNIQQDIGKKETVAIALADRDQLNNTTNRIATLTGQCQTERSANAGKVVNTYAQSNMLRDVNLIDMDNNKMLYCSIDPLAVNEVLRLISGKSTRPNPSGTGNTFIPNILNILRDHNPNMEINAVKSTGDLQGAWKNVPLDVPIGEVWISGTGFDYNLYDNGITCDRMYRSSLIDYLGDFTQY